MKSKVSTGTVKSCKETCDTPSTQPNSGIPELSVNHGEDDDPE